MDTISFTIESNAIEGNWQQASEALEAESKATDLFLKQEEMTIPALAMLAVSFDSIARLNPLHPELEDLVTRINNKKVSPFMAHFEFMGLAPLTRANGFVGRALWLWYMNFTGEKITAPFLHMIYAQALTA